MSFDDFWAELVKGADDLNAWAWRDDQKATALLYGPCGQEHACLVKPGTRTVPVPKTPGSTERHYYQYIGTCEGKAIFVR
jgi:hypothetical protein